MRVACRCDDGVFNVEGGCYAKCIGLTREKEPFLWDAIRFGTVVENVDMDEHSREFDFESDVLTENTRAAPHQVQHPAALSLPPVVWLPVV